MAVTHTQDRPRRAIEATADDPTTSLAAVSQYDEQIKAEYREFYTSGADFPGNLSPLALFDDFLTIHSQEAVEAISKRCSEFDCVPEIEWSTLFNAFFWPFMRDKRNKLLYFRDVVTCDDGKPGYRTACERDFTDEARAAKSGTKKPEKSIQFVYFIEAVGTRRVKIGTSNSPDSRLSSLATGCPVPLNLMCAIPGGYALERSIQKQFSHINRQGEWFELTDELRLFIQEQGCQP